MKTSKTLSTAADASTRDIIDQRENTYGGFANNAKAHAAFMGVVDVHFTGFMPDVQQSALMHITGKLARAVSGDINYIDNWQDIAGYAQLVVDHLKGNEDQLPLELSTELDNDE